MLRDEVTSEGYRIRRIVDLPLLRSHFPMFALGWTIMYVIDDASPLRAETAESLSTRNGICLELKRYRRKHGQTLMARGEYGGADIRWNSTFLDILEQGAGRHPAYRLQQIS